jgi:hypothetical protein
MNHGHAMTAAIQRLLNQLVLVAELNRLDQQGAGEVELDNSLRAWLVEELEGCLVSEDRFKTYLRALGAVLENRQGSFSLDSLSERSWTSLPDRGLCELPNHELLGLALSAPSLWALHGSLGGSDWPYWAEVAKNTTEASDSTAAAPLPTSRQDERSKQCEPISSANSSDNGTNDAIRIVHGHKRSRHDRQTAELSPRRRSSHRVDAAAQENDSAAANESATPPPLTVFRRFTWQGKDFDLIHDTEYRVFVAPPTNATHLCVGGKDTFALLESKHEGLRLVQGITRPRLGRRIDRGEAVTYITSM